MCSHDPFFGTNKIGSLKMDRVKGPKGKSGKFRPVENGLKARLHEISAVRFDLNRIHSGTDSPELCWVYTGPVPHWNCTVSN